MYCISQISQVAQHLLVYSLDGLAWQQVDTVTIDDIATMLLR